MLCSRGGGWCYCRAWRAWGSGGGDSCHVIKKNIRSISQTDIKEKKSKLYQNNFKEEKNIEIKKNNINKNNKNFKINNNKNIDIKPLNDNNKNEEAKKFNQIFSSISKKESSIIRELLNKKYEFLENSFASSAFNETFKFN